MQFAKFVRASGAPRLIVAALAGCALLALAAPAVRAADVENPEYKNWSAYKPGTTVKLHMVIDAAGNKTEMDQTTKLVEVTKDKAVIEDTRVMNVAGQTLNMPAQKRDVPAKVADAGAPATKPDAKDPKAEAKTTEETIEAGGKKYKCKVIETATDMPGGQGKANAKIWTSTEVPGGVVKMVTTTTGALKSESTMTLVSFEAAK